MVAIMVHHHQQQQQTTTAVAAQPINPPSSASLRSPPTLANAAAAVTPSHSSQLPSPLFLTAPPPPSTPTPSLSLDRVRLSDLVPYDGAASGSYVKAVETLAGSLMRHNVAVIELGSEDGAVMRCGLEATRSFFRARAQGSSSWGKGSCSVYVYRAGRVVEDRDSSPPCMADVFRCMGKAARASLCAVARHLRLRSDVFNHLLDDNPLPVNEASSSVLVASYCDTSLQNGKGAIGVGKVAAEFEKGLLTLVSYDAPGLQVCDPNGRWYLADSGSAPGDLLILTGKALSHITAGLRPAASYRSTAVVSPAAANIGRSSLAFRLMPRRNAVLDCSPITAAGHVVPQSYASISVSQFMDDLSAEDDVLCSPPDSALVAHINFTNKELSLRSVLSDSISGAFLDDAMLVSCGHSFGGLTLRRVIETARCSICGAEIDSRSLIPNHSLRAAAATVKHEDDRRLFHNAALRKRRKEVGVHRENEDGPGENEPHRGVQYPFSVNEKVVIEGNKRTPDKFVGKEAVITSQCLNGWYLLKILESGENVRLQYRSLKKMLTSPGAEDEASQPNRSSS